MECHGRNQGALTEETSDISDESDSALLEKLGLERQLGEGDSFNPVLGQEYIKVNIYGEVRNTLDNFLVTIILTTCKNFYTKEVPVMFTQKIASIFARKIRL